MGYAPGKPTFIIIIMLFVLLMASVARAASNYQQTRFYWDHVPDNWTKTFRVECGVKPGQYTMFGETSGYTKSLGIGVVVPRKDGTYYCAARNMNRSDTADPYGDLSNEKTFAIIGNWVYPR